MMKRIFSMMLVCMLLLAAAPISTTACAKQMEDGVPVWNEETVRQYVLDYVEGKSMDRLWGYYDLQIRRYMPEQTFAGLLLDYEWMTGAFIELGSYRSFEEADLKLKTHVIHLCMEKQDLDLYFTHKNKEDDWEVMALQFVPAEKEMLSTDSEMLAETSYSLDTDYFETAVTVGSEPYLLNGILTMPQSASQAEKVPACVLVHDFGPSDMNAAVGQTKLFEDVAEQFAEMGIATLRYDKRTFAYPEFEVETVEDEVIADALSAVRMLQDDARVDDQRIVVMGVGFGAMLAPRIASQSGDSVKALIMISASPEPVLQYLYEKDHTDIDLLPEEEREPIRDVVRKIDTVKEEQARTVNVYDHNGYYYWEMAQHDTVKLLSAVSIPAFIGQGAKDLHLTEDDGWKAFREKLGNHPLLTYKGFRGLNHLLMNDLSVNEAGEREFRVEAHLDKLAGRTLANWILSLYDEAEE